MHDNNLNQWFDAINQAYEIYYKSLLKKGKLPLRSTEIGFWGPSITKEIWDLFVGYLNLYGAKKFIDLGSGDGKVVLLASLFTDAHGIEHDEELHQVAKHMQRHFKLPTTFHQGDYNDHDLSVYDFIFIHPDKPFTQLEKKLQTELKGKLIVYGHRYQPESLQKLRSFSVGGTPVTIYKNHL